VRKKLIRYDSFEEEAKAVVNALGRGELLLGEAATVENLCSAATSADVIHISSHGFFHPTSPMSSGIVLCWWAAGRTPRVVRHRDRVGPAALLVACRPQRLRDRADRWRADGRDGGASRALFVAGAERIVVALWRVDTQATKELMRRFYAAFSQSRSAAQRLQTAAIELRNEPRWNHPYYWAPFVAYEA
jgi:CHAT domain-containing protein